MIEVPDYHDPEVTISDMSQGSPEWLKIRKGLITASRASHCGTTYYLEELAAARLAETPMGENQSGTQFKQTEWGSDHEDEARAAFQFEIGCEIKQIGFAQRHGLIGVGGSPDGLVYLDGEWGGVEIKCPFNSGIHVRYSCSGMSGIPNSYYCQMKTLGLILGLPRWHFVSYDPRMPSGARLFVQEFRFKQRELDEWELKLSEANEKIERMIHRVKKNCK